jgi:hypothetical protein
VVGEDGASITEVAASVASKHPEKYIVPKREKLPLYSQPEKYIVPKREKLPLNSLWFAICVQSNNMTINGREYSQWTHSQNVQLLLIMCQNFVQKPPQTRALFCLPKLQAMKTHLAH